MILKWSQGWEVLGHISLQAPAARMNGTLSFFSHINIYFTKYSIASPCFGHEKSIPSA